MEDLWDPTSSHPGNPESVKMGYRNDPNRVRRREYPSSEDGRREDPTPMWDHIDVNTPTPLSG